MCNQLKAVFRDPNEAVPDRGLAEDGLHLNSYGSAHLAEFIELDVVGPEEIERETNGGNDSETGDSTEELVHLNPLQQKTTQMHIVPQTGSDKYHGH